MERGSGIQQPSETLSIFLSLFASLIHLCIRRLANASTVLLPPSLRNTAPYWNKCSNEEVRLSGLRFLRFWLASSPLVRCRSQEVGLPFAVPMSLVSGPGRGGGHGSKDLPEEMKLAVQKHVEYIQTLDTVRWITHSAMELD